MIQLTATDRVKRILCLGAHADDIELGAGGTILRLTQENPGLEVRWVVFCGAEERRVEEARASAERFLERVKLKEILTARFKDAYMPFQGAEVKDFFETLKKSFAPDLIFTHFREDRHQDHRLVSDLTWNTWRDHLILEYEIFKYDGDMGSPNVFSPLSEGTCRRKVELLMSGFPSQVNRQWFSPDTFHSMLRLRGVEANSPTKFAEGFYCRKMLL